MSIEDSSEQTAVSRPAVDVVVPFAGSREALRELFVGLGRLRLAPGDSVLIVDNTHLGRRGRSPHGERHAGGEWDRVSCSEERVSVVVAAERRTPGYARNYGAAQGIAPWLLFLDADTFGSEDLLDRYFDPGPRAQTGVLAGGVEDQEAPIDAPPAARYAYIRGATSQDDTFRFNEWGFPKTANAAFRREAFEAVGGFREDIRTAEDADLTFRLRAVGWEVERREGAAVTHRARQTLRSFVVQRALYGAGAAWLQREYPGSFPARRRPGLAWWAIRAGGRRLLRAALSRDRDETIWAVFDPLEALAWELGRSLPNERPLSAGVWLRALRGLRGPPGARRI